MLVANRIEVDGLDEAIRKVRSLRSALEAKEVEKVLVTGARRIRDRFRNIVAVRSGRLKKAGKAAIGKRRGAYVASAYAAVDYKVARHAYLVEYGTIYASAHPYFERSYEAEKEPTGKQITDDLRALVKGAVR